MTKKDGDPSASQRAGAPVAANLRRLRLAAGSSQGALAQAAGIRERTVQRLEAGENFPKVATVRKLAKVLGVSPEQLQGLPGHPLPEVAAMAPSQLPPEHQGAPSGLLPAGVLVRLPVSGLVAAGAVSAPPPGPARRPAFWRCPICGNAYNPEVPDCANDGFRRPKA